MTHEVVLYADGSSNNITNLGGWGWVLTLDGDAVRVGFNKSLVRNTTNNKMEMMGVIDGLLGFLDWKDRPDDFRLTVISDSQYVLFGITKYIKTWKANGYRTSDGAAVKNEDEWNALSSIVAAIRFQIRWGHVRGHQGDQYNEHCDRLADYTSDQAAKNSYARQIMKHRGHFGKHVGKTLEPRYL